jgi:hypothetical protein
VIEGPYRLGPWPGLTPKGAGVLLGCALLLAAIELLLGDAQRALPDMAVLGPATLAPLALATRIVKTPGAAAAVCGAYLLPRAVISLVNPSVTLPPLLLIPALAFDIAVWLRADDLKNAWRARQRWRQRKRVDRRIGPRRALAAGAVFGLVLAAVEPPFAILLGADPPNWSGPELLLAGVACVLGCAVTGSIARDTGS